MIVDRLEVDPRRKAATRVIVDGRPAWTVPTTLIQELALVPGVELDLGLIDRLELGANLEAALRAALRSLERRAHASNELRLKLVRKGHPAKAVEAALEQLHSLGLLDDLGFAREYVASRSRQGRGPARLRRDLQQLGVGVEDSEHALRELLASNATNPFRQVAVLIRRRAVAMQGLPTATRRRRLAAFLARRGYQGEESREILNQVLGEPPD